MNHRTMPVSRKHETRYVISCRFDDGSVKYLAGHGSKDGKGMETVCLFTDDPEEAVSSSYGDNMLMGWPYLLRAHQKTMGGSIDAVLHKVSEKPRWD